MTRHFAAEAAARHEVCLFCSRRDRRSVGPSIYVRAHERARETAPFFANHGLAAILLCDENVSWVGRNYCCDR
jgi:hypothetical protein